MISCERLGCCLLAVLLLGVQLPLSGCDAFGNDTDTNASVTMTLSETVSERSEYRLEFASGAVGLGTPQVLYADVHAEVAGLSFRVVRCDFHFDVLVRCSGALAVSSVTTLTLSILSLNGTVGGFEAASPAGQHLWNDSLNFAMPVQGSSLHRDVTVSFAEGDAGVSAAHAVVLRGLALGTNASYLISASAELEEGGVLSPAALPHPFVVNVFPAPRAVSVVNTAESSSVFQGGSFDLSLTLDVYPRSATVRVTAPNASFPNASKAVTHFEDNRNGVFFTINVPVSGSYQVSIVLTRSDGTEVVTSFQLEVLPSPPRVFAASGAVECMARFPFRRSPVFTLYLDKAKTVVQVMSATATVRLSRSTPDFGYTSADPSSNYLNKWGTLMGVANTSTGTHRVATHTGVFEVFGLGVDRPGSYELQAVVVVNGVVLTATEAFTCLPHPAFEVPPVVGANSRAAAVLRGSLPFLDSGLVRVSTSGACEDDIVEPFVFPAEPGINASVYSSVAEARQAGEEGMLVPVHSGQSKSRVAWVLPFSLFAFEATPSAHVCLQVSSHPGLWVPLWAHYEQAHEEPVPVTFSFEVKHHGTCTAVSRAMAANFHTAAAAYNWADVTAGRRYGCRLAPPVNGSLPPCDCPVGHVCSGHIALQDGRAVDVGMCQCCQPWLLAVVYLTGSLVFLVVSYWLLAL